MRMGLKPTLIPPVHMLYFILYVSFLCILSGVGINIQPTQVPPVHLLSVMFVLKLSHLVSKELGKKLNRPSTYVDYFEKAGKYIRTKRHLSFTRAQNISTTNKHLNIKLGHNS